MQITQKSEKMLLEKFEMVMNRLNEAKPTTSLRSMSPEVVFDTAVKNLQKSDVFFSNELSRLRKIRVKANENTPTGSNTMEVDGKSLWYHDNFIKELVDTFHMIEAVEAIIVHELLHIRFKHLIQFAKELNSPNKNIRDLVNIATDLAINDLISGNRFFPKFKSILIPGVNPEKEPFVSLEKGKSARYYFNKLLDYYKNQSQQPQQGQPQDQQGQGQGQDQKPSEGDSGGEEGQESGEGSEHGEKEGQKGDKSGEGDETGEGGGEGSEGEPTDGDGEGEGGEGGEEGQSGGKAGKPSKKAGEEKGQGEGGEEASQGPQQISKGGTPGTGAGPLQIPDWVSDLSKQTGQIVAPKPSEGKTLEDEIAKMESELTDELNKSNEQKQLEKDRGIVRSGAFSGVEYEKRDVKVQSKIPWSAIVKKFLTTIDRKDKNILRPSRRSMSIDPTGRAVEGTYTGYSLDELFVIIDVSGSTSGTLQNILGDLVTAVNIPEFSKASALRIITFNHDIQSEIVMVNRFGQQIKSIMPSRNFIPETDKVLAPRATKGQTFNFNDLFGKISPQLKNVLSFASGGGTIITPVFDGMRKLGAMQPKFLVIITDGELGGNDERTLKFAAQKYQMFWGLTKGLKNLYITFPGLKYDISEGQGE